MNRGPRERCCRCWKIASWPFLLNEAADNVPIASHLATRSRALVTQPPFSLFVCENKMGWGELWAETPCRLVGYRNIKLLSGCGNMLSVSSKKASRHLLCLFLFSFFFFFTLALG